MKKRFLTIFFLLILVLTVLISGCVETSSDKIVSEEVIVEEGVKLEEELPQKEEIDVIKTQSCIDNNECMQDLKCINGKCATIDELYDTDCEQKCNFNQIDVLTSDGDQLDEADDFIDEANKELDSSRKEFLRIRNITILGKNFFLRYWWEIIILILILGLSIPPVYKKYKKKMIAKKLSLMKRDMKKYLELIKKMQKVCFVDKKISTNTYKMKAAKYEEKITELKHTLPVLEAQLGGKKVMPDKKKVKGIIEIKNLDLKKIKKEVKENITKKRDQEVKKVR